MTVNTIQIPAGKALEALKTIWEAQKSQGIKVSTMMWGKPGIGKTQVAEQLAEFIGGNLYDVRLTTIDSADLNGLPYYNHETKTTEWYRPQDLPNSDAPAVLFLDELSSAPAHIQPTVYGLLQERRVGQHKIPDNTIIVAAGNQVTDGAVAYEMGTAIADRLIHLLVVANPEDWVNNFAVPRGLHPAVVAFVKTAPQHFETTEQSMTQDHLIAATPRSWERVSQIMKTVKDPVMQRILVSGTIGDAISNEFFIVADDIAATVQIDEMLKKPRKERLKMVPVKMHGLNAMVFGLVGIANEDTLEGVVEVLADIADTQNFFAARSSEDVEKFKRMPLRELATFGMETVMTKALANPAMVKKFVTLEAYKAYAASRKKDGL
jgi:SpoVK/Ycf46/Vps4 family AAA+-type ATPase